MNNLNDNSNLINFFNDLFKNEDLTVNAPLIMKFFIITRNYGLINFKENISKLMNNNNFNELIIDTIKTGFTKDNITYDKNTLLTLLINNYYQNGFYFHSFPGIYKDSIKENGILASNRNDDDNRFYSIIQKYGFNNYFANSNNRVCVTEQLSSFATHEYSLFTPEWLELFLSLNHNDVHQKFKEGNLEEMLAVARESLTNIKSNLIKHPSYDENDYIFLEKYITMIVYNRFKMGNNTIGIALIEKQKSTEYFGKSINIADLTNFMDYINARKFSDKETLEFMIDGMAKGEKDSEKSIPANLINIVSYQLKNDKIEINKTK